ncbi:hypothetical protein [Enterobacter sp. JJBC]|uniref:hypothetical protein n=1 Tax=Enterobacter sp. JJBC TaxID=3080020 RepID=UPI0030D1A203
MTRIINTLCPYSLIPLSQIEQNGEHVVLAGLGAPESFTVNASKEENTRINNLLDEPFLGMGIIKLISSISGLQSRSGVVKPFFNGVTGNGEEVLVRMSPSEVTLKVKIPVVKDANGDIVAVTGYEDEVQNTLSSITKKYEAKGFTVRTSDPLNREAEVALNFNLDLDLLNYQYLKVAYLTMVYVFGDIGIKCSVANEIRNIILNKLPIPQFLKGVRSLPWDVSEFPFLPRIDIHKHIVASFNLGAEIFCVVSFFGTFNKIFMIENEFVNKEDIFGEIYEIDYKTRKINRKDFPQHFTEIADDMKF